MRNHATPAGRQVLVGALVGAVGAWILGYPQLAIFALAGVLLVGAAFAWSLLRTPIEARRAIYPPRVSVDEHAEARLRVTNRGRNRGSAIEIHDLIGAEPLTVDVPPLGAGEARSVTYPLPTRRRGVFTVGPLQIGSRDPFGLVANDQLVPDITSLTVYPRIHPIAALPAGLRRDLEGPTRDTSTEGSITFHAVREYVVGDDLRSIHWKSTAKTGTLMVRQYTDTSQPRTLVVLDNRRSVHTDESFEEAVEIAASLVVASIDRNFPVALIAGGGLRLHSGSSSLPAAVYLDELAAVQLEAGASLAELWQGAPFSGVQSLIVVTSAALSESDVSSLGPVRSRVDAMSVVNVRPDLGSLPIPGGATVHEAADAATFAREWNENPRR